ncbi:hypothetical protein OIU35_19250 [Boseaceae bacterium BT-24-1]|nr:hypothetical protein [Boseaceae bacterium BT-24-1]
MPTSLIHTPQKLKRCHRLGLFSGVASILAVLGSHGAFAEVLESFYGAALRSVSGAGIVVTPFKRGNGAEALKIRANARTAQAFVRAKLPNSDAARPYDFFLEIGAPAIDRTNCSKYPATAVEFEDCITTRPTQSWRNWDVFELDQIDADLKQIGLRSKSTPTVYGLCAYAPSRQWWVNCDYIFEQGGHRHVLNTSSRALDNINLFRCAALELRNAIWTDAPAFADTCP